MKLIYKAGDIIEAHIISGLLDAEGIESHVSGHYLQGAVGELAPTGFSNIHVDDKDIDKAKTIIAEYENKLNRLPVTDEAKNPVILTKIVVIGLFAFFIFYVYILTR